MSGDLILPLKAVYFDQIKAGTKLCEFRLLTDYWTRRLVGRDYRHVVLMRGYPKGGGVEGVTRLTREWQGYTVSPLVHEHFGPDPVTVYCIDVTTAAEVQA